MTRQNDTAYGIKRLESKNARAAIIQKISTDFNLGLSHKAQILELYFKGYTFTEIQQKTNHSERAVWCYLRDFTQVATRHHQGFHKAQIRLISHPAPSP